MSHLHLQQKTSKLFGEVVDRSVEAVQIEDGLKHYVVPQSRHAQKAKMSRDADQKELPRPRLQQLEQQN